MELGRRIKSCSGFAGGGGRNFVVVEEYDLLCAFTAERLLHLGEKAVDFSVLAVQPDDRVVKLPLAVAAGPLDDFMFLFGDAQIDSFSVG